MLNRRTVLAGMSAATLTGIYNNAWSQSKETSSLTFKSGQPLPAIGMGTWLTFNLQGPEAEIAQRRDVLREFYSAGGGMIDSSPMYGRSEKLLGQLRDNTMEQQNLFSATKIWTPMTSYGGAQLTNSHTLWKEPVLDLVHVHNLLNWQDHLRTLEAAKETGKVRYIGLTTSHGRRHEKLEELINSQNIDAVQLSYNIANRAAENRLLPAAQDKGLAVIINRPFMTGSLFRQTKNRAIPEWAKAELGIQSWAEFFLKFIISHPAVTCVIPATRQPSHMRENMRALSGPMPDHNQRQMMIANFNDI